MAGKPAELPRGARISDFVSLGVLTTTIPPALIERVLAATGRHSVRQRQLPARLVVYPVWSSTPSGRLLCRRPGAVCSSLRHRSVALPARRHPLVALGM